MAMTVAMAVTMAMTVTVLSYFLGPKAMTPLGSGRREILEIFATQPNGFIPGKVSGGT